MLWAGRNTHRPADFGTWIVMVGCQGSIFKMRVSDKTRVNLLATQRGCGCAPFCLLRRWHRKASQPAEDLPVLEMSEAVRSRAVCSTVGR